jgi:hypothetical protein
LPDLPEPDKRSASIFFNVNTMCLFGLLDHLIPELNLNLFLADNALQLCHLLSEF